MKLRSLVLVTSTFILISTTFAQNRRGPNTPEGIVRPRLSDTIPVNVYADNWFKLYINGKLVAVDSIDFMPHNVISVDILPEYPMNIAVMAKDGGNAETGLEYNNSNIGDGGFILKIGSDIVTDSSWKAKNFFHGPINSDKENPRVRHLEIPDDWYAIDFDDSSWEQATEYAESVVRPRGTFSETDFDGAKFIWTGDLDLDNTIIFRKRVERPGWKARWNVGER
jgi:hypothetical protein